VIEDPERPFSERFTTSPPWVLASGAAFAKVELGGESNESDSVAVRDVPVDGVLGASTAFSLVLNLEAIVVTTRLGENEPKGAGEAKGKSEA
jgi:hypothetical protein